jgi:hypothetical protein
MILWIELEMVPGGGGYVRGTLLKKNRIDDVNRALSKLRMDNRMKNEMVCGVCCDDTNLALVGDTSQWMDGVTPPNAKKDHDRSTLTGSIPLEQDTKNGDAADSEDGG